MKLNDLLFLPLYLLQSHWVKRYSMRLPEADGTREGEFALQQTTQNTSSLSLMMVGDSSACGVGVDTQEQALIGQLLNQLRENTELSYVNITWQLHATTGHTSDDVLNKLYVLPKPAQPLDVMIIVVGVNDVTKGVSVDVWQQTIKEIIDIANRKFEVKYLFFSGLPPMRCFPALPMPLSAYVGQKASILDQLLLQICQTKQAHHVTIDFLNHTDSSRYRKNALAEGFAEDGFHPNEIAYAMWAESLARRIASVML